MTIKLYFKYLGYDVAQLTHRYSKMRLTEPEQQFAADLQGGNESDTNLVIRYSQTGVAKLRKILGEYIKNISGDANDELGDGSLWEFEFISNKYDGKTLADLMHWFIVRYCIYEWLKYLGLGSEAKAEKEELKDLESELKKLISDGGMPVKDISGRNLIEEDTVKVVYTNEA